MCKYAECSNKCPYNKCSINPSKNHAYILNKKNNGPLNLFSKNDSNMILLVFEAPGIDEWRKEEPISSKRKGSAAVKFNKELKNKNKNKEDYDIAEAVRCFPGTSTKTTNQKDLEELKTASKYCQKYLEQILKEKDYTKIVCFGKIAKRNVYSSVKRLVKSGESNYTEEYLKKSVICLTHPMYSKTLSNDIISNL